MKNSVIILMLTLITLQAIPSFSSAIPVSRKTNFLSVRSLSGLLLKLNEVEIKGSDSKSLSGKIALGILNKADFKNKCKSIGRSFLENCLLTITFKHPPETELRNYVIKVSYTVLSESAEVININVESPD